MAAPTYLHRNRPPRIGRRAPLAASLVDAAFVGLEPGATVTSHLLWALTMLALLRYDAAAFRRLPAASAFPAVCSRPCTRAAHAAGAA